MQCLEWGWSSYATLAGVRLANNLSAQESFAGPDTAEAPGAFSGWHERPSCHTVGRGASGHREAVLSAAETAHRQQAIELSVGR